jgi:uncharacterized repeat protein (TIGR04076 family)
MVIHDVKIKIVSQKGSCGAGHKKGDEWVIRGQTPAHMCNAAYTALAPFVRTLQYGGEYEWPLGSGTLQLCCTDPFNPVVFEITRIPGTAREVGPRAWVDGK